MGLKYTKMPTDTSQHLVLNAGILVDDFNPATGEYGNILGATSGGISFASNPNFVDFGEDIDNAPGATWQLKRIMGYDPTISGTYLTVSPAIAAGLIGAADVDSIKVTPRAQLAESDFKDIWFIGDYSDVNTGENAGFLAIKLAYALNTTGFQIQSGKDAKGTLSFEYHGHYDLEDDEQTPPFEIYCKTGSGTGTPSIVLNKHSATVKVGDTVTLTAAVHNSSSSVTWTTGNSSTATVSNGVVEGKATGNTIITASITESGVTYNDTCTVKVNAAT